MNRFLKYFFRGLLFLVPLALTVYIVIVSIQWLDNIIDVALPGVGLVIILAIITMFGYLASTLLARPLFDAMERALVKIPLVSLIYTSIKDLISAFVGEKRKFDQPVVVVMDAHTGLKKFGFITQDDLNVLDMPGDVAVYLPHSYNFSGNLYILPRDRVSRLDVPGSEVMKFIVSGGVSGFSEAEIVDPKATRIE
ncbi:DUF502 domain-containing protein [Roseivirga sp. BDSF3-8]|uniref:DUF502 domain-containing protein n=1 Tax=Roseivirga sp. BDSF3-8 TaxID=3241598 RepID=UPI00353242B3